MAAAGKGRARVLYAINQWVRCAIEMSRSRVREPTREGL